MAMRLRIMRNKGRRPEKKLLFFWILSKLPRIWTTCTTFFKRQKCRFRRKRSSLLCISRSCWLNWDYMFSFEKAEILVGKVNWTVQQKLFKQNQLKSRIEKDRYNWQIEWNRADHRHPSVVLRCRPWGVRSDCRSCGIIPSDSRLTKCFLIPIIVIIINVITRIISSS